MTLIKIYSEYVYYVIKRASSANYSCIRLLRIVLAYSFIFPDFFSQCIVAIGSSIDPLEGCSGLSIGFLDQSLGEISRVYDFGDGSELYNGVEPPVHTNTKAGEYNRCRK